MPLRIAFISAPRLGPRLSSPVPWLTLLLLNFVIAQGEPIRRGDRTIVGLTRPALPPPPKEVWNEPVLQIARLSEAMAARAPEQGRELFAKLLAAMARAGAAGKSPALPVAAALETAGLPPLREEQIMQCMKMAWRTAHDLGMLLPESLAILDRGELPPTARQGEAMRLYPSEGHYGPGSGYFELMSARHETERLVRVEEYKRKDEIERQRPLAVRIVSIGVGAPLRFSDFGAGPEQLFINEANTAGITFTVVNPALMQETTTPSNQKSGLYIKRIPHKRTQHVAWNPGKIPDSLEKGTHLTTVNFAQVYLTPMGAAPNTFRLAVRHDPKASPVPVEIPPASRPGFVP